MSDLTNEFISLTYGGLLHTGSMSLTGNVLNKVYDGFGNPSPIKISESELEISGTRYPSSLGTVGSFLQLQNDNNLTFIPNIPLSALGTLSPSPSGNYTGVKTISVNEKGLVTNIEGHSGSYTVTSTTYVENAGSPFTLLGVTNNFVMINVPNVPTNAKTVILYARVANYGQTAFQTYKLEASPDGTSVFPALYYFAGTDDPGDDPVFYGFGGQFTTRVGFNGGNAVVYIRNSGEVTDTVNWEITLIGYQV